MKGGSLASDSVMNAVDNQAFEDMTKQFSNMFGGGNKKKKLTKRKGDMTKKNDNNISRCPKCGLEKSTKQKLRGGNVDNNSPAASLSTLFGNASKVLSGVPTQTVETFRPNNTFFTNNAGIVPNASLSEKQNGGKNKKLEGGALRNISEYSKNEKFKLFNTKFKGGTCDNKPVDLGLDTKYNITNDNTIYGNAPNRVPSIDVLTTIANEQVTGPQPMMKTTHYGDVSGIPEFDTKFSFKGGKSKRTRKQ